MQNVTKRDRKYSQHSKWLAMEHAKRSGKERIEWLVLTSSGREFSHKTARDTEYRDYALSLCK